MTAVLDCGIIELSQKRGAVMGKQMSFTDYEYSQRKRKTKREEFLECMDEITPWDEIVALI